MRIISTNPWGKNLEAQRSDYWAIDMGTAITVLTPTLGLQKTHQFYASSVQLPELAINAEVVRRDSRPYNYPSWDAPLSPVRIAFIHNVSTTKEGDVRRSEIYQLLNTWRQRVRAGRGGMSSEPEVTLDANFKAPRFRFDITVKLGCGYPLKDANGAPVFIPGIGNDSDTDGIGSSGLSVDTEQLEGDFGPTLEVSSIYLLKNAWLGALGLGELSYENASVHKINATFFVDDVVQL
jgi:hypothetical protein